MRITFTVTTGPLAGRAFHFEGHDVFLVGRSPNAHCRFPEDDPFFSRVHFLVEVNPPRCRLTDMGSRNGTFVNARKVEVVDLADGDEIRAGHTRISVKVERSPANQPRDQADAGETHTDMDLPAVPETLPAAVERRPPADAGGSTVLPVYPPRIGHGEPRVPGYQLVRVLGRGSMGVVYLGRRESDGR